MEQAHEEYEPGKIFVGGLSWETTEDSMRAHFEQFGEVEDCVVMKDHLQPPDMKRNRGFGFVKFKNPQNVLNVTQCTNHILDQKKIDPKPAVLKGGGLRGGIGGDHEKKIFAGGILSTTTPDEVRDYFISYLQSKGHMGTVVDVDFKMDKDTHRMRGFGFVGFDSVEARNKVLECTHHHIGGKAVEVKSAQPRGAITGTAVQQQHLMNHPQPQAPYPTAAQQYHQQYQQSGGSNGQYPGQYYPGAAGAQPYYPPNPYQPQQQGGYGQQYSNATGYSTYDHSSYPRTQTSTDRQDTQSYYQQQHGYGHGGAQQLGGAGYGQETTSYPAGRSAYPDSGYSQQQMPGYGRGATQQQQPQPQTQTQPQPRYGAGGVTGNYGN